MNNQNTQIKKYTLLQTRPALVAPQVHTDTALEKLMISISESDSDSEELSGSLPDHFLRNPHLERVM